VSAGFALKSHTRVTFGFAAGVGFAAGLRPAVRAAVDWAMPLVRATPSQLNLRALLDRVAHQDLGQARTRGTARSQEDFFRRGKAPPRSQLRRRSRNYVTTLLRQSRDLRVIWSIAVSQPSAQKNLALGGIRGFFSHDDYAIL
jgi:hypothetical protein